MYNSWILFVIECNRTLCIWTYYFMSRVVACVPMSLPSSMHMQNICHKCDKKVSASEVGLYDRKSRKWLYNDYLIGNLQPSEHVRESGMCACHCVSSVVSVEHKSPCLFTPFWIICEPNICFHASMIIGHVCVGSWIVWHEWLVCFLVYDCLRRGVVWRIRESNWLAVWKGRASWVVWQVRDCNWLDALGRSGPLWREQEYGSLKNASSTPHQRRGACKAFVRPWAPHNVFAPTCAGLQQEQQFWRNYVLSSTCGLKIDMLHTF